MTRPGPCIPTEDARPLHHPEHDPHSPALLAEHFGGRQVAVVAEVEQARSRWGL